VALWIRTLAAKSIRAGGGAFENGDGPVGAQRNDHDTVNDEAASASAGPGGIRVVETAIVRAVGAPGSLGRDARAGAAARDSWD
jgi:hypothetical protein